MSLYFALPNVLHNLTVLHRAEWNGAAGKTGQR